MLLCPPPSVIFFNVSTREGDIRVRFTYLSALLLFFISQEETSECVCVRSPLSLKTRINSSSTGSSNSNNNKQTDYYYVVFVLEYISTNCRFYCKTQHHTRTYLCYTCIYHYYVFIDRDNLFVLYYRVPGSHPSFFVVCNHILSR